ncbi:MAG TPA: TIR domain-containing protein [Thermoanaerobaculia bacterium]|nr:TIR domain-containing protein [Thermoanaerobaculia bacterium]
MEKVLLADNNPKHLETWAAVLTSAGYEVTKANSVSEAQKFLIQGGFDLAVLDLHMVSDEDDEDHSGLRLAQLFRETVPIIMLTAKATVQSTRDALQRDGRSSPAVALVRKVEDGVPVLLEAARSAIEPKVFVSHGHDPDTTSAVVRFLARTKLRAIVLKEQPVASQTIIEAFEQYANVQFAIVLMTPDDEGRFKGMSELKSRARQNVIFELGFLVAKLGRERVVALMKPEDPVEKPSNYEGVRYREFDPWGNWEDELIEIMKAARVLR